MNIEALVSSLSDSERKALLKSLQQTDNNAKKEAELKLIDKNKDINHCAYKLLKQGKVYAYCYVISPFAAASTDVTVFMFKRGVNYSTVKAQGNFFGRSFDENSRTPCGQIREMPRSTFGKPDKSTAMQISWDEFKEAYTNHCETVLSNFNNDFFEMENSSATHDNSSEHDDSSDVVSEDETNETSADEDPAN